MTKQYISKYWVTHEPVLLEIKWVILPDEIANQPIFILDKDPKACAQSLTMYHITKYIEYIVYSIMMFRCTPSTIAKLQIESKPRVDYMFYNQRTAYWFYNLYQEMQEVYKKVVGRYYKVSDNFNNKWIFDMTKITGPLGVKHKAHKGAQLLKYTCMKDKYPELFGAYNYMITSNGNAIGKFRIMYMIMGYLNSEFPLGAPAWYNNMKTTIWKSYNKMTRLYYRIDTSVEGVYSYYYSVDDKNWIEIQNVPLELRNLIDGIIFVREC